MQLPVQYQASHTGCDERACKQMCCPGAGLLPLCLAFLGSGIGRKVL